MVDTIENYEHLWANKNSEWALFQLNHGENEVPRYMVVNRSEKSVLVIEDDAVAELVKQKMLTVGVPIVWVGNGF
jgi:hypothetical protein